MFYALSYFIVSLIFLGGFVFKEEVACNKEVWIDLRDVHLVSKYELDS